jgi:DNA-directed RNA polymerase specialized sigma24 family protein
LSKPQDPFDALLAWLNPDRDLAAQKYETIRAGLVRIFVARGFSDAEDLADEVIRRVCKRLPEIRDTYFGEPARYFHGVLRNVIREEFDRKEVPTDDIVVSWIPKPELSDEHECLQRCLKFLKPDKCELILDYYVYDGHDKIENHRTMAEELDITEGALRGRTHQIRKKLEECVRNCVQDLKKGKQKESPQA